MTLKALSLLTDPANRRVFEAVTSERKIRFGELQESLGMEREDALEVLGQLEAEGLIKSQDAPGKVEDLRWYYITEEGLAAERELHRLELVP